RTANHAGQPGIAPHAFLQRLSGGRVSGHCWSARPSCLSGRQCIVVRVSNARQRPPGAGTERESMTVLYAQELLTTEGWLRAARVHLVADRIVAIESGVSAQAGDERHAVIVPAMPNV